MSRRTIGSAIRLPRLKIAGLALLGASLLLSDAGPAAAHVQASPHGIHEHQPDGTEIVIYLRGNEGFSWEEDANGFTVVRDNGRYVYARQAANGRLVSTPWQVGKVNPVTRGLRPRELPSRAVIDAQRAQGLGEAESAQVQGMPSFGPSGAIPNLVVPIRFSNHTGRTLPSQGDLDILFNAQGGHPSLAPTGSIRDVYLENSYGQMSLNSTVVPWVTVSQTEAYYADGVSGSSKLWQALREALDAVDATTDFTQFDQDGDGWIDAVAFIHSGYGAEWGGTDSAGTHYSNRIWSHRWGIQPSWTSAEGVRVSAYHISPGLWGTSGSNIGRIGVIAHETGHFFGLPDLYDTNGGGEGIGSFGLMANSWGFDFSQLYPPHFSPWSKIQLGWLTPMTLSAPGSYSLRAAETHAEVYRIDDGFPSNEYLLIENRQPLGFDSAMPQGGLVIWHIDDEAGFNTEGHPGQSNWPENGNHYRVSVLQADGKYELEKGNDRGDAGDVFHGDGVNQLMTTGNPSTNAYQDGIVTDTGHEITDISEAGSTMTFNFNSSGTPATPPAAPSDLTVASVGTDFVQLTWADNATDELGFQLERRPQGTSSWTLIADLPANSQGYSDTNLPSGASFDYRVRAYSGAGDSAYDGPVGATTTAPSIPAAPSGLSAAAITGTRVDLSWGDAATNENGYRVRRAANGGGFSQIADLPANSTSFTDNGVSSGNSYDYQVAAYNNDGEGVAQTSVTVNPPPPPPPSGLVADGEMPIDGAVSGSYQDTRQASGAQQITEVLVGMRGISRLEHFWRFDNVPGGNVLTFSADVSGPSSDGDRFDFHYAPSQNGPFTFLFSAKTDSSNNYQSVELPSAAAGTFYIRVRDSSRSRRSTSADTLTVRHLYLEAAQDAPLTAPGNLSAQAQSDSQIQLTWNDASGEDHYEVERLDGNSWNTVDSNVASGSQSFTAGGLQASTGYTFRVCAVSATSEVACSGQASATTDDSGGGGGGGDESIELNAVGTIKRGKHSVTLTWSGALGTKVLILRDGSQVGAPTRNDGIYRDNIGANGSATYSYQICEQSGGACSNTEIVVY
ncbi:MAG: M6 family metalloprotease domain-containing protein [Pseudomonadota bacterium]